MKKILTVTMLFIAMLTLAACNNKKPSGTNGPNGDDDTYDLGGMEINIVSNIAARLDPRSEEFERLFRTEKIKNIKDAEEKYNIKVKYVDYPASATWGSARDNWIIDQAKMGNSNYHIFEVSSNSIATLAAQEAILPLNKLIADHGDEGFWDQKRAVGTILGEAYAYDDNFPIGDEGIYYNSELMAKALGAENKTLPTDLWESDEWTWDKFREITLELKKQLVHTRPAEDGGPQYVMGGRTYDWVYPMVGTNGGTLVNNQFEAKLNSPEVTETLDFLSALYEIDGMWIDDANISNTVQSEFRSGNVAFHVGQSWFLTIDSKWKGLGFDVDFVPFPKGPRVLEGEADYVLNNVKGDSSFVLNSAFDKANIPEGYEDMMLHDEVLFKIWNDLLYFPELESNGDYDLDLIRDDFYSHRLLPHYASEVSREAHLSILDKSRPDFFYSVIESQGHVEGSFMMEIEKAIRSGDVRGIMDKNQESLQTILNEKIVDKLSKK